LDAERKKFLIRSLILLLIGLLVFVVYLVFFVNIGEMIEKISQANPFIYFLTFVAALLDVFFFALAWRYLMRALSVRVSIWKTYIFMWVSIFIDSIIPAESVSGEISRAYLMSREPQAETGKVVVSLVIHRIIMVLITIVTLLSGVLVLFVSGYPLSAFLMYLIWLVTIVAVAFLAFVFVLLVKEKWMERFVDMLLRITCRIFRGRWHLEELRERALVEVRAFYDGLETLGGDLKHFVWPVVSSFVSWMFSVLVLFLVFVSLGFSVNWTLWSIVVVVFSLIITIKSIPVGVPAEIGLPEIAMTFLFTAMGIAPDISAAVTILSRLVSFAFKFVIGFVATQWVGIKTIMDGMKLGQKD
jgi:uncharacterized protein (TIRG00374 family)